MSLFLKKYNISNGLFILFALYLLGSVSIALMYIFGIENNIIYHSIFFLIIILINQHSMRFYQHKNKINQFLFFSIFPFVVYLLLVALLGNKYFLQYKLLFLSPIFLSFYQILKIFKIRK